MAESVYLGGLERDLVLVSFLLVTCTLVSAEAVSRMVDSVPG